MLVYLSVYGRGTEENFDLGDLDALPRPGDHVSCPRRTEPSLHATVTQVTWVMNKKPLSEGHGITHVEIGAVEWQGR